MLASPSLRARRTGTLCAEKALSSHAICVPTSVEDPVYSWRYRKAHEEREVAPAPASPTASTSRTLPSLHKHVTPQGKAGQRPMALLFPGSGSQYPNMGSFMLKDHAAAREVWEEAEEALAEFGSWQRSLQLESDPALAGLRLKDWEPWNADHPADHLRRIVFGKNPPSVLMKSSNSQPAILITSMAYLRVVEKELGIPLASHYARFFLGHSSGEYSAACAAGAFSFKDAVKITKLHGLLTSRTLMTSRLEPPVSESAPPARRAQMSALLVNPGRSFDEIAAVVQRIQDFYAEEEGEGQVSIAAYNSSAQVVLSGTRAGVEHACDELAEHDIATKATDLPTWVPFHTAAMHPAEEGVRLALQRGIQINPTRENTAIVSCISGQLVTTPSDIAECLVRQISLPVRWSLAIANLRHVCQVREMVYFGPHKALSHLATNEVAQLGLPEVVTSLASRDGIKNVQKQYGAG